MILKVLSWCPGLLGLFLRQKLLPFYFKKCGRSILIGRFVSLRGIKKITIGNGVVINDYACLDATYCDSSTSGITIEDNVFIGAGTKVINQGKEIVIQEKANIGSECRIISDRKIVLEENVLLAAYCRVGGTCNQSQEEATTINRVGQFKNEATRVGNGCWLGVRTLLYSGVQVGEETIVGAHGIVKESLDSRIVAIGNPAKMYYPRV